MSKPSTNKSKTNKTNNKRRVRLAVVALVLLAVLGLALYNVVHLGNGPVAAANTDQKPAQPTSDANSAVQSAATKDPAPTPAPATPAPRKSSTAKTKKTAAPKLKPAPSPVSNQNDGGQGSGGETSTAPGFTVDVDESAAEVDEFGQLYFPFEVTFVNGYVGDTNKPFNLPEVVFVSGPDATAMSPTGLFGKEQPNWPNGGMSGFVGFVVYEHVVAGDYTWKITVTDGQLTATDTFVVSLVETEE